MWAVIGNHTEILTAMLQLEGIDVNAKDNEGMTILMFAIKHGHIGVDTLLQVEDINVNDSNNLKYTALIIAVYVGNTKLLKPC